MKLPQLDRKLAAWPGVTLDVKWGADRVYSVGGRMFAVTLHEPGELGQISFKVPDEQFLAMTDQDGILAAPYLARAKWVQVKTPAKFGDDWLLARLRESYELIAARLTAKARRELGIVLP